MTILWKSLVQPNFDYCSQLWSPVDQPGPLGEMEEPLRAFTRKVNGCHDITYWQRLEKLKLTSIQFRYERYKIMYTWKSISGLVPSLSLDLTFSQSRGRSIVIPIIHGSSSRIINLMERSLKFEGAKLFNSMPVYLRNMLGSKEQFKSNLDQLLSLIPDQPASRGLVPHSLTEDCQPTNSVKYWTKTLNLQSWRPAAIRNVGLSDPARPPCPVPTHPVPSCPTRQLIQTTVYTVGDEMNHREQECHSANPSKGSTVPAPTDTTDPSPFQTISCQLDDN